MIYLFIGALFQGLFKSISDALMSGLFQTKFGIENPVSFFGIEQWRRKYKNNDSTQGERFWLSTSVLVWLTDGWHLSNALGMISQVIALFIALRLHTLTPQYSALYALVYWLLRSGTHHIVFTYFFKAKTARA